MTDFRALVKRYLTDMAFRISVGLYNALLVNLTFVAIKMVSALLYDSLWFGVVAVYYAILSILCFLLLRYMHLDGSGCQCDTLPQAK